MSESLNALFESFERVREEVQTMAFMPRGIELQESACQRAEEFLEELSEAKDSFVSQADESAANAILALELSLRAPVAELMMWVSLKRDEPDAAWDQLITAQELTDAAIRVRLQIFPEQSVARLESYYQKLLSIESIVFPPQVFNSFGAVVKSRDCTVCGEAYEECPHIQGRVYMGQVCGVVIRDLDLLEVSIVNEPADKRARVTHFSETGGRRNRMTWRIEPPKVDGD